MPQPYNDPMRHFIAYHNTEKMGYSLPDGNPQRVLAKRPVNGLRGNTVWLVEGTGTPRQYCLASVFRVDKVGETDEGRFTWFASGPGHFFHPHVPIKHTSWFPEVLRVTGNFAWGVRETKDHAVIAGLTEIAKSAGYKQS
jgi:hypothetical protein